jgi:hypothetical protein
MGAPDKLGRRIAALVSDVPLPQKYIRAYHGSPYDFDRFDASKIGAGEGAQAYGHGLYFSEAEPVADWYRKGLSGPPELLIGGEPLPPSAELSNSPRERALRLLQKSATTYYDDPVQAMREAMLDASDQYGGRDVQPIIDALMRFKSDGVSFGPRPGKTYEVEIAYPQSAYLDFDAPMSAQGPGVMKALQNLDAVPELPSSVPWEPTGQHAYKRLVELRLANARNAPRKASELLAGEGVPGIRYLDEYSRGAKAGTHNIVAFPGTEDSIRILRKYGLLSPIAAGAAAGTDTQED